MIFKRSVQRYGRTPVAETPYQRAGQLWDERIGSARVQAANWRRIAFGSLALAAGLGGATVWQSMQSRVIPYVVEVDRLGEARDVAPAIRNYKPTDGQVAWHLARFIVDLRSVSTDPVLVKRNWLNAYDFATNRAALFLNQYARNQDPFAQIGERSVSVEVTSVVRASDNSFQVKWIEQTFDRGSLDKAERWTAILTVVTKPPTSADALRRNPLGLFVNAIDWSHELEVQQPSTTGAPLQPAPAPPTMPRPINPEPAASDLTAIPYGGNVQ